VTEGSATVLFLPPETRVDWTIHSPAGPLDSGTTRTGSLPSSIDLSLSGSLPGVGLLGLPVDCGNFISTYVLVIDPQLPNIVWYADMVPGALQRLSIIGATWETDGVWTIAGRGEVRGVDWYGQDLGTFTHPDGLPLHHDLLWREGALYALDASSSTLDDTTYVLDGIVDLSAGERVWSLADHVTPSGGVVEGPSYWGASFGPEVVDWSHANTLAPDGDGWLVSLRHLDAVIRLNAAGEIDWTLGAPDGPLGTDFMWQSEVPGAALDLRGQHHATRLPDGRILVFDNRAEEPSRVIAVRLDGSVATITDVWPMGIQCAIQGGAALLEDGTLVATCASSGTVVAFGPDGAETGRLTLDCPMTNRPSRGLIRAVPVQPLP
jgi:hypothetical protein